MSNKLLTLASSLINIQSITPQDNGCQKIIAEQLKALGFTITSLDTQGTSNLWAELGDSGPLFVFSGHTDTVPAGDLNLWASDPFTADIRNNTLYGRGAADMKAAIAAMLMAYQRFLKHNAKPSIRLGIMITSDEEGDGTHGTIKIVDYLMAKKKHIQWCLIGEASSQQQLGDSIKVGRRGSLHGELHLYGKQGHIAYPHLASNPIHRCFKALDALTQTQWDQGDEHFSPSSFQIYHIHADTGASNIIPGSLSAKFNFRFSPCSTAASLQKRLEKTLADHSLEFDIEWNLSSTPFLSKPGALLKSSCDVIEEKYQIKPYINTDGGTSDGRFIAKTGCEIIELGPINKSIHQVNEHIALEDLEQLCELYTEILTELNALQHRKSDTCVQAHPHQN